MRVDLIDRFTRDRASRFVWGLVAIVCAVAFVFARQGQNHASGRALEAAGSRSLVYANQVVAPLVEGKPGAVHLDYRTVYPSVQAEIFTDPRTAIVRVWAPDGRLLFASDGVWRLARQIQLNDAPGIQAAMEGRTYSQIVVEPYTAATTGAGASNTTLFQTYTPLLVSDRIAPVGAVEIDYLYDALQSEGASAWWRLEALLAALFLVSLGMFVLSMRAPVDTEDTGTSLRGRVNRLRGGPTLEPGQPAAAPPVSAAPVSPGAVPVGSKTEHEVEAANARIAELEEALAAAEWEASGLRASDAAHATTVAALESERRALEARAEELSAHVTSLEAQLAELETSQGSQEPQPEEELEPSADEQTDDPSAPLEVRVAESEQRVTDADDLRARLARTAARKKGITTVDDGDQPD